MRTVAAKTVTTLWRLSPAAFLICWQFIENGVFLVQLEFNKHCLFELYVKTAKKPLEPQFIGSQYFISENECKF